MNRSLFVCACTGFVAVLMVPFVVCAAPSDDEADGKSLREAISASGGSSNVVDMVLASIDGEPVTMTDLKKFILTRGETVPGDLLDGSPEVRRFLKELVVDELVAKEAAAANITVGDEEIEAYMEEIQRQNGVDRQAFLELLKTKGLTQEIYRTQIRADILRTRILSSRVRSKVNILDEEIDRYVEAHPKLMPKSGERHMEQVSFPYTELDRDDMRAKADQARVDISNGTAPSAIADGNYIDLGFVDPDDLKSELQEAAEKLSPGDASEVVDAGGAFVVIKLAGDGEKQEPDKEMREQVRRELMEERFKSAAEKYLNEDLPKKYHVELKL